MKILLPILLLLAGCSGQIKGAVYLDTNSNSNPDPGETTLTGVPIKVTYENQVIAKSKTDSKGLYVIGSKGQGHYCIEVEDPSFSQNLTAQISSGTLSTPSLSQPAPKIGIGPSINAAKSFDVNTMPVCGNNKMEGDEECDDGNRTDGDGCSSTCKNQPLPEKPSTQITPSEENKSGKRCINCNATNCSAHVGVTMNYDADISNLPPPTKQTHRTGEDFFLNVIHPIGGVLEPIYLPDVLEAFWPADVSQRDPNILSIDPASGRIEFAAREVKRSVQIPLRVKDSAPFGTTTITFPKFKVKTPDGQSKELPYAYEMDIVVTPDLEVIQSGLPASARAGGTFQWELKVKNKGARKYKDLKLIFTVPTTEVSITNTPPSCDSSGDEITCPIDELAAHATLPPVKIDLKVQENVSQGTRILFDAKVKIPEYDGDISAEESSFSVSAQ